VTETADVVVIGGGAKTVDLDAFALRRFAEGRSPEGPHPYAPRADHADLLAD
jgi:hypothetical protein